MSHVVGINYEVQMMNKTSTRLPEAFYYTFHPLNMNTIALSKAGHRYVDPYNVVLNGSQFQHGNEFGFIILLMLCMTYIYIRKSLLYLEKSHSRLE